MTYEKYLAQCLEHIRLSDNTCFEKKKTFNKGDKIKYLDNSKFNNQCHIYGRLSNVKFHMKENISQFL